MRITEGAKNKNRAATVGLLNAPGGRVPPRAKRKAPARFFAGARQLLTETNPVATASSLWW
ncbi:MAG: hypothetical protein DMF10_08100 [Verrucomicrobia bacterium]|nr:MAG: hypothetical protein DMF10_08100 [Verrucomicrobiota bacterium]PYL02800.1 MAG: hypothetical protein DME31_08365 [Verrucomicrobiota bacterium]